MAGYLSRDISAIRGFSCKNCFCFDRFSVFPRRRDFPHKIRNEHEHTHIHTLGAPRRTLSVEEQKSSTDDVRARRENFWFSRRKIFRGRFRQISLWGPRSVPGSNGSRRRAASNGTGPDRPRCLRGGQSGRNGTHGKKPATNQSSRTSQNGGCLMANIHTHGREAGL